MMEASTAQDISFKHFDLYLILNLFSGNKTVFHCSGCSLWKGQQDSKDRTLVTSESTIRSHPALLITHVGCSPQRFCIDHHIWWERFPTWHTSRSNKPAGVLSAPLCALLPQAQQVCQALLLRKKQMKSGREKKPLWMSNIKAHAISTQQSFLDQSKNCLEKKLYLLMKKLKWRWTLWIAVKWHSYQQSRMTAEHLDCRDKYCKTALTVPLDVHERVNMI